MVDPELSEVIEREVKITNRTVTFDNIAGLDSAKKLLTEAVTLPLVMPDFFTGIREPWKGVLLFGPPGTGKTLLAKTLLGNSSIQFFNCTSATLTSKYRGESEKLVKAVFSTARQAAPSIVFFDEADALISKRGSLDEHEASRRFKSELLQQMDGVMTGGSHVIVLATSNCPWDIDEAMLRRFEKRIYVPLPDATARMDALRLHLKVLGMHLVAGVRDFLQDVKCAEDVDMTALTAMLDGYSGADLRLVCKDASMMSLRKVIQDKPIEEIVKLRIEINAEVTMDDFLQAVRNSNATVSNDHRYREWAVQFANNPL